ncbi:hypothetical protein C8J57DRAFT_1243275 [Mycena rebaudengoi]|nr:hypothetical protein C8J57DRAFT_1243275 [Mycena rebaudengoi]
MFHPPKLLNVGLVTSLLAFQAKFGKEPKLGQGLVKWIAPKLVSLHRNDDFLVEPESHPLQLKHLQPEEKEWQKKNRRECQEVQMNPTGQTSCMHKENKLRWSLKRGFTSNKAPAVKKGKKAPILDLDHAGTDDNDFDEDLGGMEKETKFMEQLDNTYGHCQACGPMKFCKITVGGTHHHLNNGQWHAWAQSLNLFGMFFKTMLPNVVQPIPIPPMMQTQLGGMLPFMMPPGYPYMLLLWGVHGAAPVSTIFLKGAP